MNRSDAHHLPAAHRFVAVLCIVLLGVYVIRVAAVTALSATMPDSAATVWSGHPDVQSQLGLVAIGAATAKGQPVPPSALAALQDAATRAPLDSAPFLVRGVQAQTSGDRALAEAAFLAAERRDPRSLPARYFLAEQDLRGGNISHGLQELGALALLSPDGGASVAPFIATIAHDPHNWPAVRALLSRNPGLAEATLTLLAANAANADSVVALANPATAGPTATWAAPMLQSLINAGDYAEARQVWARLGKVPATPVPLLFDASFQSPGPPAPFNWALTSSSVGLAERQPGGRLHVIFYGQQDGALARQLLVLPPGNYSLAMRVAGAPARLRALSWTVTCASGSAQLGRVALGAGAQQAMAFSVPSSCPAQWLELAGASTDIPQQVDATISGLHLERGGNGR